MRNHFRLFFYREFCNYSNLEQNLFSRNHFLDFHYVIKEMFHAFSCAYIEVWMHLGSLESTQEARAALLSCSPNFPRASITRYTHAKHEPILNCCHLFRLQRFRFSFKNWPSSRNSEKI